MEPTITRSPEETRTFAGELIALLALEQGRMTGTIVALQGDLGAGKTVFAQGVAAALGVAEQVTSPTYVIEKVYALPFGAPWKKLIHIDAYRLQGEEELHTIGWSELATDPGNLVVVEWPEQVGLGIPERAVWVSVEQVDEMTRMITVNNILQA